jgi:hypothetical protein
VDADRNVSGAGDWRGPREEVHLAVGEEDVVLLYTNWALEYIEGALKKSVFRLLRNLSEFDLSYGDLLQVLVAGMEASRRDRRITNKVYGLDDARRVIDARGFLPTAQLAMAAVAAVFKHDEGVTKDESPPLGTGSAS